MDDEHKKQLLLRFLYFIGFDFETGESLGPGLENIAVDKFGELFLTLPEHSGAVTSEEFTDYFLRQEAEIQQSLSRAKEILDEFDIWTIGLSVMLSIVYYLN